jgi:hypothetical protein
LIAATALLLVGCGKQDARNKAMAELMKACTSPPKISLKLGGISGDQVHIECEVKPTAFDATK